MKVNPTLFSLTLGSLLLGTTSAHAFSFNSGTGLGDCDLIPLEDLGANDVSSSTVGTCTTDDGFTLQARPAKTDALLTKKEVNQVTGVGIFHDTHDDGGSIQEIDRGEVLRLTLDTPKVISSLDLSFLYPKDESGELAFGDLVNEVARVRVVQDGGNMLGTLRVISETQAKWIWDGTETILDALSDSNKDGGGWYSIANPFGDLAVDDLRLLPAGHGEGPDASYKYSDFALVGATAVPEPATVLGLAAIAGGAALSRRRRS